MGSDLRETPFVYKLIEIVPNVNSILFITDLYQVLIEDILREHDSASADRSTGPSDKAGGENSQRLRGNQPPGDPSLTRHAIHTVKRWVIFCPK